MTAWLTLANAAERVGGNGLGFREVALLAVALVAEAALAILVVIGG